MIEDTPTIEVPADPAVRASIKGAIEEISGHLLQKSVLDEMIKDVVDAVHEKHEFPKAALRKLGRAHFKADMSKQKQAADELSDAYDILMGNKAAWTDEPET